MTIRTYQVGDEKAHAEIYNSASASLTCFKPVTAAEIQHRFRIRSAGQRFYAEEGGLPVGYIVCHANGRVSFPWCLPGHESAADTLLEAALAHSRSNGRKKVFAAYRPDWLSVHAYFVDKGFQLVREMINYVVDLIDMPTPSARVSNTTGPVYEQDIDALYRLMPKAIRSESAQEFGRHLFRNPYFASDSLFTLRSRQDQSPIALGILVHDARFASPKAIDSNMPCFRLGAFGTEGMQVKRVQGLFSFLVREDQSVPDVGLELLGHAVQRLCSTDDVSCIAAQASRDVPALVSFYERTFRRQGSFPVFEKFI